MHVYLLLIRKTAVYIYISIHDICLTYNVLVILNWGRPQRNLLNIIPIEVAKALIYKGCGTMMFPH